MGYRRNARELAMQALYFLDMDKGDPVDLLRNFNRLYTPSKKIKKFYMELVHGTLDNLKDIDRFIEKYSANWKLHRMSCVDRNILRVAVFEIVYCEAIPSRVTINEAIDIGKKFGTKESGSFINGIIDAVANEIENK